MEKVLERLVDAQLGLAQSILQETESYVINPQDYGINDDPRFFPQGGFSGALTWMRRQNRGEYIPAFLSEPQLDIYRKRIRGICVNSEIALNVINNRISYAVGTGLRYNIKSDDDILAKNAQAIIDAFCEHNRSYLIEAEGLSRMDIDGEAFGRLFPSNSGILSWRFVEPEFVRSPTGDVDENSFGIRTLPGDVQSVTGYWIDGELISAEEICHLKHPDTPSTSKRGLSAFFPVESTLKMAEELLFATTSMAKTRAKLALIRKLAGTTSTIAQALIANQTTDTINNPLTGQTMNIERLPYGGIYTIPDGFDVIMPSANIAAADQTAVMQQVLRFIGARFNMPEYMISSDASNANYASTMVAESPFVKSMERLQKYLGGFWGMNRYGTTRSVLWSQIRHAIKIGLLPADSLGKMAIDVVFPSLVVRDKAKESQVDKTYYEMGVKSKRTIQLEQGLDPDNEDSNFANELGKNEEEKITTTRGI